ncbi:hypothetical protein AYX15_07109 [Cryptococcus neoformans]|nr:hypothetical protein AYX15_07109 [Cryptococcus neoformans var. grubii]
MAFRKPAAMIARLRVPANIEQWRAEDNEDNDCSRTFQRRAVHRSSVRASTRPRR